MKTAAAVLCLALLFCLPVTAAPVLNEAQTLALARFCAETAPDAPLLVQMSLAAVMLNRLSDPAFPDTLDGNLALAGFACAPVRERDLAQCRWGVRCVLCGMDPTEGAVRWAKTGSAAAARMSVTLQADGWCFGK